MFQIKSIKKSAKSFLKKNKWTLIVAGILTTFIVGETTLTNISYNNLEITYDAFQRVRTQVVESDDNDEEKKNTTHDIVAQYSSNLVSQIFSGDTDSFITEYNKKNNVTKGVFYDVFSIISTSRIQITQFFGKIINSSDNSFAVALTLALMALFSLAIKVLLTNPLLIGQSRLFLESINYHKTRLRVIGHSFRRGRYPNSVKTVLLKNVRQILWNITIIGGIIKNYSYKMVTYICAENTSIKAKDAIKISREMMNGHKFESFKIDLSFLGWNILIVLTFGLAGIFVKPYYESVYAEYYSRLRKEYIENKKYKYELLNDFGLYENLENKPTYSDAKNKEERRLKVIEEYEEINSKYDWLDYIIFFFIFAIIGWLWEVLYFTLEFGVIVNRGALYGPWLPIYGFGCSFVILIFSKLKRLSRLQANPFRTFLLVMLVCTFMEYMTSFVMEKATGVRYWEYSGIFLNLNGRVCLENSIFFGVGGCLCIYLIGPLLQRGVHKIRKDYKVIACTVFSFIIMCDALYSTFVPHTGKYITETNPNAEEYITETIKEKQQEIEEKSNLEEFVIEE